MATMRSRYFGNKHPLYKKAIKGKLGRSIQGNSRMDTNGTIVLHDNTGRVKIIRRSTKSPCLVHGDEISSNFVLMHSFPEDSQEELDSLAKGFSKAIEQNDVKLDEVEYKRLLEEEARNILSL